MFEGMGFLGVAFLLGLYFLPSIGARLRGHPNAQAIIVLNLFLGWTFVGWVVALIWAVSNPPARDPLPPPSLDATRVALATFPAQALPGRYRVTGVDRASKLDVVQYIEAESAANARAKGELAGTIVTEVELAPGRELDLCCPACGHHFGATSHRRNAPCPRCSELVSTKTGHVKNPAGT